LYLHTFRDSFGCDILGGHAWPARYRFEIVLVRSYPVASANIQRFVNTIMMRVSTAAARPDSASWTVGRPANRFSLVRQFGDADIDASRQSRGFCLGRREDIAGKGNGMGKMIRETARDALRGGVYDEGPGEQLFRKVKIGKRKA
jgi:hypothetical protein